MTAKKTSAQDRFGPNSALPAPDRIGSAGLVPANLGEMIGLETASNISAIQPKSTQRNILVKEEDSGQDALSFEDANGETESTVSSSEPLRLADAGSSGLGAAGSLLDSGFGAAVASGDAAGIAAGAAAGSGALPALLGGGLLAAAAGGGGGGSNNRSATISGDDSGEVTEDGDLTDTGTLVVTDQDAGESYFIAAAGSSTYGDYTVSKEGAWEYTLDNSKAQFLGKDETVVDSFIVRSADGTTKTVNVTVVGVNDAPEIVTADKTGTVFEDEDTSEAEGVQTQASGTIVFADVDTLDVVSAAVDGDATPATKTGKYGDFELTTVGDGSLTWVYTLDNSNASVQALAEGATLTETFTVTLSDGNGGTTSETVTVTIVGKDEPVVIDDVYKRGGAFGSGDITDTDDGVDTLEVYQGAGAFTSLEILQHKPDVNDKGYSLHVDVLGKSFHIFQQLNPSDDPDRAIEQLKFMEDGRFYGYDFNHGGKGGSTIYLFDDTIAENVQGFTFTGSAENDVLMGSQDFDVGEVFNGGDGHDLIFGGKGNDTLNGDGGEDLLVGGDGADSLNGGADNDVLVAGKGDDVLNGGDGNDMLWGIEGNNRLFGDAGNDTIYGGTGKDTIYGGAGNDRIDISSGGDDSIYFESASTNGVDTIIQWSKDDFYLKNSDTTNSKTGDAVDVTSSALTLVSNGSAFSLAGLTKSDGNAFNTNATDVVILQGGNDTNADLGAATNGSELLKFLASTGTATGITMDNSGDGLFLVAFDSGNAYLFHLDSGGDSTVDASEITLVGIIDNTSALAYNTADFAKSFLMA